MGSCAAPSAKGDDKFITTDYLQQCQAGWYDPLEVAQWLQACHDAGMEVRVQINESSAP
ncbi:hypothetical protein [Escherichia coli]|uniref:hypothetical protein n=1 Tax=Escherichia coli TaxID=562 RepID=UPI0018E793AD|nr:hypothetical protein [Escherichia coli]MBJ2012453.1 hypothetical protein [Escherichia coli]